MVSVRDSEGVGRSLRLMSVPFTPKRMGSLAYSLVMFLVVSVLAGVLVAGALYGFAVWATARDPEMLRILLTSSPTKYRYDPGKHERVDVEISTW